MADKPEDLFRKLYKQTHPRGWGMLTRCGDGHDLHTIIDPTLPLYADDDDPELEVLYEIPRAD